MYYKARQSTRTDVNQLKNEIIRKSYSNKPTAKIEKIEPVDGLDTPARKIEDTIKETAGITILVKRAAKKPWIAEETLKLADEKRTLKQTKDVSKGESQQYKNLCKQIKKVARQDKEHWIQQQCEEVKKGGNTRQAYSLIKMLRREFFPRLNPIRDQDGKILQSQKEIIERWTVYCDNLYKYHREGNNMIRDLKRITLTSTEEPQDILYSEVEEAIGSLKKNKIPGSDRITTEMLQAGGE